jgi:hypothetical protein
VAANPVPARPESAARREIFLASVFWKPSTWSLFTKSSFKPSNVHHYGLLRWARVWFKEVT